MVEPVAFVWHSHYKIMFILPVVRDHLSRETTAVDVSAKMASYSCFYWKKYNCT